MRPVVVCLLGFPAAGKLTIAKELVAQWPDEHGHLVAVDDHRINNVSVETSPPVSP